MLDTNICSYIMRAHPPNVLQSLQSKVENHHLIVISAIIKKNLSDNGTPISNNETMIAGHALSVKCVLVTNNTKEFIRIEDLLIEDWV